MQLERFEGILDAQIKRVRDVLLAKREEYASGEDVLANMRRVAQLRNVGMPQALSGKMAKHTISIYDMIESGQPYPMALWDEKITDHINYLILLKACLHENAENPLQGELPC